MSLDNYTHIKLYFNTDLHKICLYTYLIQDYRNDNKITKIYNILRITWRIEGNIEGYFYFSRFHLSGNIKLLNIPS